MAEAKAAPRNQLVDFASAASSIIPMIFGSPKSTRTQTANIDPMARETLGNIIQSSLKRASSPEEANAMVQDIMRRASIAFAPAIGESNRTGLYNNQTLGLLRDQAVADATGAGAKAVLDYQTANQRIAADAAGALANSTRTVSETSKTAPAIDPKLSIGIGGLLAAKTLWNNRGEITDFVDSAFGGSKSASIGADFAGGDPAETGFNAFSPNALGSVSTPVGNFDIGIGTALSGVGALAGSPALGVMGTGFNIASNYVNYDPITATLKTAVPFATQAIAPGPIGMGLNFVAQKAINFVSNMMNPKAKELTPFAKEFAEYQYSPGFAEAAYGGAVAPGLSGNLASPDVGYESLGLSQSFQEDMIDGGYMSLLDTINTSVGDFGYEVGGTVGVAGFDDSLPEGFTGFDPVDNPELANPVAWDQDIANMDFVGNVSRAPIAVGGGFEDADWGTNVEDMDIGTGAGYGEGGYGGGGSDDVGGSDSIICTELHKQGRLNRRLWIIGTSHFRSYWSYGRKGYYLWSRPSVEHLRKHPNSFYSKLLENVFNRRAHYVAASRGYKGYEKTVSGAIITKGMYALCWLLAVFVCAPVDLFRRA